MNDDIINPQGQEPTPESATDAGGISTTPTPNMQQPKESSMTIDYDDTPTQTFNSGTNIKVIGIGGGGGNAVAHMLNSDRVGIDFIFANTDAQDLAKRQGHTIVQLGTTGQGAGSDPEAGRTMTQAAEDQIRAYLTDTHLLFITAGMGGGTGTGGAPVVARIARDMGILTVAVVTKPFGFEGNKRTKHADAGLAELEANVDALIVVLNDKLLEVYPDDITMDNAYAYANDVLKNAVCGISDIINIPGTMNVDFADVTTIMRNPGKALMGIASAEGADRAKVAAEQAIACPLLEGVNLQCAKGMLVVIATASGKLKLTETSIIMNTLTAAVAADDGNETIKFGTVHDDSLGDKLSVTVVATGLGSAEEQAAIPQPLSVLRTGTHDQPFIADNTAAALSPTSQAPAGVDPNDHNIPAFIRSGRGSAALPQVSPYTTTDSRVGTFKSSGMEDHEIPAFMRKQAD